MLYYVHRENIIKTHSQLNNREEVNTIRSKELEKAFDEMRNVLNMLEREGESRGECSYREIVYTSLLFILDSLRVLRTLLSSLLGLLAAHFFLT